MPRNLIKELDQNKPKRNLLQELETKDTQNVFLEDVGQVVSFTKGTDLDEVGNTIQKDVYKENLEDPSILDTVRKGTVSIGLGMTQPILSSPSVIGSLMQEFGETFAEKPTVIKRISSIDAGGIDPKIFVGIKQFISKSTGFDKYVADKGKKLIAKNEEFMKTHNIRPEEGKVNEFLFALGSGATSLAQSIALYKLTGNPNVAAAVFGVQAKARVYQEAREAGKPPQEAQKLSNLAGVAEAGLEYVGLDLFFKKQGRGLVKAVFRAFVEGSQEVSQELANNIIIKLGGVDEAKNIFDGVVQSGSIGFILGGGASVVLTPFEKGAIAKDLQDKGLTPEEATKTVNFLETETDKQTNIALKDMGLSNEDLDIAVEKAESPVIESDKVAVKAELAKMPKITKESVKRTLDTRLENEIQALEEKEDKRLSILDKAQIELKGVNATIAAIRETPEFNAMGENIFEGKQELLKDLIADRKIQQEKISKLQPEKIAKTETTILKEKIQNIQRGIREGVVITKQEIKQTQTDLIGLLEASDLEAADKAKFIRAIKNMQTQEQLINALPTIRQTIARLEVAAIKRDVSVKIKKELKTTKPLKVGQKRVGKFDYETNKQFDTLRDCNKLTQAKAQEALDAFPAEITSEVELIKARFLSLKANGASASAEIHAQVLKDIMRIKELGKQAKDEATLEKMLNREERVDSALESIDRIKANKKTVKTRIGNIYRKGFTNMYSMFNAIGGKNFAETYDPILSENKRNTATYGKTLEMTQRASKIYDEKNVMRMFERMSTKDYYITDLDGLTTELSKLELVDIYNSIKNNKKRNDYYEAFGDSQVQTLLNNLTENDILFADSLQEAVQGYREILNKRNIEITGRDLGYIENYWPGTSEYQVSVFDDMRVQGETPSALKERAKSKVIPVPKNAWYKAQRHIAQAEHVNNVSREYETLKRMFSDRKVKHAITQKFGEDVYNTINAQIDNISLNKQTERIDAISSMFQKAINNWVTAKIALNPSTFVRQLMSVGNYAEVMNPVEWTAGFFEGISHPKATFDYMWKNAPFLEARFNKGYSEALKEAIDGAESISVNKTVWTRMLTSLVRSGDITAIIYGGYPLAKAQGFSAFENATLKAQQSGLSSGISQFQNSRNPFTRLFLAFKNTSNQYFRKMVDSVISYQNKDISTAQFAKTMTIYAVIQPIMYVSAGFATKAVFGLLGKAIGLNDKDEDWEELWEKLLNDIMIQLIVSPVNSMPIIDDIVKTAARKLTGQKVYQVFSTPLFDDLERGVRALTKEDITGKDYLTTMTSILEPITAAPMGTAIRYYEILTGKKIAGSQQAQAR